MRNTQKGELKMDQLKRAGFIFVVILIVTLVFVETKEQQEDYEMELWEAKIYADCGDLICMENHLSFAGYKAEDDVDISTAVREIRLHGREVARSKAFKSAEEESSKGNDEEMNGYLRKHIYLCSVLDKEPDEEAIEKLKEICQKNNKSSDGSGQVN